MLRQNQLFRRLGLSSFPALLMEVTRDPAMLLWLSGVDNEKGSPNENYARELMELFTLGADRGAYTEHDVREQARALTGFRYTWSDNARPGPLPLRPEAPRHRLEAHLRQARPLRLARLVPPLRPPPAAPVVLRHEALELLRPDAAQAPGRSARSSGSTSGAATRSRPVVDAILRHPALYTGPRMVKSPARLPRRAAARPRPRHRHRGLDVADRASPASSSSTRRTSRAGTTRAGSTRRPSARAGRSPATRCGRSVAEGRRQARPAQGRRARQSRARRPRHPTLTGPDRATSLHALRQALARRRRTTSWKKDASTRR